MKIIFSGTADFAIPALKTLLNSQHNICAVYTKPDKPAGRGQKLTASAVKLFALDNNLPVYQPDNLQDSAVQTQIQNLNADIFIDVAYGMILPAAILNMFKFGCVNIHPSLLPKFRGAAPIQRAILEGEKITGVTIMTMDAGLDTGDMYCQELLPIKNTDTSASLFIKASELGAKLLLDTINSLEQGLAILTPQNNALSTYAHKITKEEGKIDWHQSAQQIDCKIRAFNPWPIAYTTLLSDEEKIIRIWQAQIAEPIKTNLKPGTIYNSDKHGIEIITGEGIIRLLKIQLPGGKVLSIQDILNSHAQLFAQLNSVS